MNSLTWLDKKGKAHNLDIEFKYLYQPIDLILLDGVLWWKQLPEWTIERADGNLKGTLFVLSENYCCSFSINTMNYREINNHILQCKRALMQDEFKKYHNINLRISNDQEEVMFECISRSLGEKYNEN